MLSQMAQFSRLAVSLVIYQYRSMKVTNNVVYVWGMESVLPLAKAYSKDYPEIRDQSTLTQSTQNLYGEGKKSTG